jgi:16S rRNA processing protein RimM
MTEPRWIEVGRIGAPHGVRGWVKVQSFMAPPERLFELPTWRVRAGSELQELRVETWRVHGDAWVAKLVAVDDRNAAQRLTGAWVDVDRGQLAAPREREHYLADLIGLRVLNADGVELGVLDHFVTTPANDVMVVRGTHEHWVPVTKQHLLRVDSATGTVHVDWPEDF